MISILINTSKPEVVVCLLRDTAVVSQENWKGDYATGTKLLSAIDQMMQQQALSWDDVSRIAVHRGPGHYSALRTGITAATFLAMGIKKDLIQVEGEQLSDLIAQATTNPPVEHIVPIY